MILGNQTFRINAIKGDVRITLTNIPFIKLKKNFQSKKVIVKTLITS